MTQQNLDAVLNREVDLGGSVDDDLSVRVEVFRACDTFVSGCSAGESDHTRMDNPLESADTESAGDFERSSVSCKLCLQAMMSRDNETSLTCQRD